MATSGRLGQVGLGEDFSVRYDIRDGGLVRLTDKITGAFRGGAFQLALASVHEAAAIKIQEGMVKRLDEEVKKTGRYQQRGGYRLQAALTDERNREVTASSFLVGRSGWLDQSEAKLYWRQIEEGNPMQYLWTGFFTNDFGRMFGPWSPDGHTAQSALRSRRSGNNNLYSRPQPEGYKHGRFPQQSRGVAVRVGPFPAYEYSRGGAAVFRRYPWKKQYQKVLDSLGLTLR